MRDRLEDTARAEGSHFWFRGFRMYVVPTLQDVARNRCDLRIVDCGCGTGFNLRTLLSPHGTAVGFDFAADGVQRAKTSGRPVVRADIQHVPLKSEAFDLATSFDVFQSVPDDRQALREMARVIKPGGHVVLNVTAMDILRGDHSDVWDELRRYTPERAARLVEQAGLEVVRIRYLFGSLLPLMLMVRTAQRLMRRFRDPHSGSDLTVPPGPVNVLLTALVAVEVAVARWIEIPFGSSLLIVARKPD
jgi:ubiquinone/menaquinone biosynthesis C-methylase UbiE